MKELPRKSLSMSLFAEALLRGHESCLEVEFNANFAKGATDEQDSKGRVGRLPSEARKGQ
jgi:hypothetical protein